MLQANANRHMRGAAEMIGFFRDVPRVVVETIEFSSWSRFVMKEMRYQFPVYPIPADETIDTFCKSGFWKA